MKRYVLAFSLLAWTFVVGSAYAQKAYTLRDLGNFGGRYASVVAINDHGVMLVSAQEGSCCNPSRYFLVDGSRVTQLPAGMVGNAINNRGEVAGTLVPHDAVIYRDGTVTRLAPEAYASDAFAINDKGDVAGVTVSIPGFTRRTVIWENGASRVLDEWAPAQASIRGPAYPTGINEKGLVVGYIEYIEDGYRVQRAVYWDLNGLHHLSPPRAPGPIEEEHQYAVAVNKRGDILVHTYGYTCVPNRVFIVRDGAYLHVPLPPVGGTASAINDAGEVAGRTDQLRPQCGMPGFMSAFVGDERSSTVLPTPADVSSYAFAINKHGTVGGMVNVINGERHAAIWEKR